MALRREKLDILKYRYGSNARELELDRQLQVFEAGVAAGNYPQDDDCLDMIDEYFSQLVIVLKIPPVR